MTESEKRAALTALESDAEFGRQVRARYPGVEAQDVFALVRAVSIASVSLATKGPVRSALEPFEREGGE